MLIKQIRSTDGTGTLSYIVADEAAKLAAIIDPNREDVDLLLQEIKNLGLTVTHIIDTHTHADHVSGAKRLKELTGAPVLMHSLSSEKYKYVDQGDAFGIGDILRENVKVEVDLLLNDGDVVKIGAVEMNILYTPGHTNDHISLLAEGHLFTGDLLLIGQAGRSDLPSGNTEEQYDSLFKKILPLPDATVIHPGHDYEEKEYSDLATEKRTNPFLQLRSKAEYLEFVHEFFPPMADSGEGKVVLQCGVKRVHDVNKTYKNVTPQELQNMMNDPQLVIIDVREPKELAAFGAIEGVINIPVGELIYGGADLSGYANKKIAVICQSGGRSMEAAHYLTSKGEKNIFNVTEGTLGWMRAGLPLLKR